MAALLRGGRAPSRLWDELWLVYSADADRAADTAPALSSASVSMLAAARAAAARGLPVAQAIRTAASGVFPGPAVRGRFLGTRSGVGASRQAAMRERRIWGELAACFVIAEASGCPLADVLARLAAQLEVEDDAEAVRQTALAGPRATVTLLTWLPLLGLGLGAALGVDPLSILLGTPLGMAALGAGVALTIAGRIWSAKLVRSATGGP
jgi:tight adherence protein B